MNSVSAGLGGRPKQQWKRQKPRNMNLKEPQKMKRSHTTKGKGPMAREPGPTGAEAPL